MGEGGGHSLSLSLSVQLEAADNNHLIHHLKFKEQQNIIVKTALYARGNEVYSADTNHTL